jgi:hypothetical protein
MTNSTLGPCSHNRWVEGLPNKTVTPRVHTMVTQSDGTLNSPSQNKPERHNPSPTRLTPHLPSHWCDNCVIKVCKRGCKFECLLPLERPLKLKPKKYYGIGYRVFYDYVQFEVAMLCCWSYRKRLLISVHKPRQHSTIRPGLVHGLGLCTHLKILSISVLSP